MKISGHSLVFTALGCLAAWLACSSGSVTVSELTTATTVTATVTHAVTPSAGPHGSISPNSPQTVNHNSTTQFMVTPNLGYAASVGGSCGGTLTGTMYTTQAITTDCTVTAAFAPAVMVTALSCSSADVTNAIAASGSGGTVVIPAGTCTWANYVTINKTLTIQGAGIDQTVITGKGFSINTGVNDYRITGITFDGNWGTAYIITHSQARTGNKRFRIDHNKFMNKAYTTSGTIVFGGYSYGVVDHNVFQDCLDEILSFGGDGANSLARDNSLGLYDNGTIFVEDNQFTLTNGVFVKYGDQHYAAENIFDGNSGPRVTFRHNTITDHQYCRWLSAIEAHGFESEFSTVGDARGFNTIEVYENAFVSNYPGGTNVMKFRGMHNGGVIYNNTRSGSGTSFQSLLEIHNLRSHTTDDTGSLSKGNINAAGYAQFCHARQADETGLICEHCGGHVGLCFGQVNNLYIWNNAAGLGPVSVEGNVNTQTDVVQGVNYFLSQKSGYVPYTYPHPLASVP